MSETPAWGTAKIKCAKRKCGWTGLETDLVPERDATPGQFAVTNVCPKCFDNKGGYYILKDSE